jgi:hypothetical protein
VKRAAYHVDADEIAASDRLLVDGFDVMKKLRPQMIDARTPTVLEPCNIQNVWINGERITLADVNERLAMAKRYDRAAQLAMANPATKRGPHPPTGTASVPVNVLSVLASIHAEHIEEINYTDCNDFTVERPHARNAVFVVLKRGVKFEPGIGTYVDDAPLAIAANRMRLVGTYDDRSGNPLAGVQLVDSATASFTTTSETGTAVLAFLADGPHTLTARKAGYSEQRIHLTISSADSIPITLVLAARAEP